MCHEDNKNSPRKWHVLINYVKLKINVGYVLVFKQKVRKAFLKIFSQSHFFNPVTFNCICIFVFIFAIWYQNLGITVLSGFFSLLSILTIRIFVCAIAVQNPMFNRKQEVSRDCRNGHIRCALHRFLLCILCQ